SYKLKYFKSAFKEWKKLDPFIKKQFKKHLIKRLENPYVESAKLKGYKDLYKIKLRSVGYRLAYVVNESEITIYVISVGRRDTIYELLTRVNRKL
ncbi:MAG: type II toxin-antitoxin system RelE/ParE family toxin, partial [Deltaproteobacteria bacterium]|nr:type II toxin-antitoxin system RelE/ParE family toxin [Deltaproteobacteria bacterium]